MPDEASPDTNGFDLARAIVALAKDLFDPFPHGLETPDGERQRLRRRVVDAVEWYTWPIDDTKLHQLTGVVLRSYSALDRNVELKHALHPLFKNAADEEREKLVRYYVTTWGGINIGDNTCRQYARGSAGDLAGRGLKNIASRSKALVLHDPSRYAIYDSRVAVSLNYLVIRRVGHDRGYIGQKDGRKCFPLPPSKAKDWTESAHGACRTLSDRFAIPFYENNESDFYADYLRGIREAASRLSDSENRKICMHWVESMLFGMAERCAHGLWAACRLSEPLSVTLIAGPRKAALIDILERYRLPWTWETPEEDLEEKLRQFSERVYRQFLWKDALIGVLDQHGLPWTWETPEKDLEERMRQFSEQVYRQFLREHPKS